METTDIVIIGAGPVGLFTAFQAGMLKLSCQLVDTLETIGGQCAALYPEKPIYDIPAWPEITGGDLIEKLAKQMAPFTPKTHLSQQLVKLQPQGERFLLETSTGTKIDAGAVMIAAGAGAFGPNRPPLDGLEKYEKTGGVQYCVRQREAYRDKDIVIAGGGDSAVDWAISLSELAKSVSVVHRRAKFRAAPESTSKLQALAEAGKINLVTPYQLVSLTGDNGQLTGVTVKTLDGKEQTLPADVLLPFFGLSMDLGPILDWGLNIERQHIETTQYSMETSIPGIYAVGDVATYRGKLKLISTGFAEAATACHHAWQRLHPDEALHFEYSTSKGVPA